MTSIRGRMESLVGGLNFDTRLFLGGKRKAGLRRNRFFYVEVGMAKRHKKGYGYRDLNNNNESITLCLKERETFSRRKKRVRRNPRMGTPKQN